MRHEQFVRRWTHGTADVLSRLFSRNIWNERESIWPIELVGADFAMLLGVVIFLSLCTHPIRVVLRGAPRGVWSWCGRYRARLDGLDARDEPARWIHLRVPVVHRLHSLAHGG